MDLQGNWTWLAALAGGFVLGSLPFAYWMVKRIKGTDIRREGSGNPGATNVARVLGKRWGLFVLALDIGKGALAAWLPVALLRAGGAAPEALELLGPRGLSLVVGVAAFLGHCFSPFLGFRGGKGVATAAGVYAVVAPKALLLTAVVCVTLIVVTRLVSLASITGSVLLPAAVLVFYWSERPWAVFVVTLVLGALVIFRHRSNIRRLLAGQEHRT